MENEGQARLDQGLRESKIVPRQDEFIDSLFPMDAETIKQLMNLKPLKLYFEQRAVRISKQDRPTEVEKALFRAFFSNGGRAKELLNRLYKYELSELKWLYSMEATMGGNFNHGPFESLLKGWYQSDPNAASDIEYARGWRQT